MFLLLIINLVTLLCTCSRVSISFLKYGFHICTQYSNFGLTNDWYNIW